MGWALTGLGVGLVIVVVVGAALALCRRYCIGWQWGTRNIWSICEEWRQRLSWLWAPREEKVGLVKAQHPTAQTVPGLYRQTGNPSEHLLHSDSDLRLDAQGAFTRFEAVDRDLHPPLGTGSSSTIPPQPLRPAPQPRPTSRPRPSPLQTPSTVDYLRMQESDPGPLTPPPPLQRTISSRGTAASVFVFQNEPVKNYGMFKPPNDHSAFRFDGEGNTGKMLPENIQMTSYTMQNHSDSRMGRYDITEERRKETYDPRCNPYRQFETNNRYNVHNAPIAALDVKANNEDKTYAGYDVVQRNHQLRQHVRNDSRGSANSFGLTNHTNSTSQTIMESIYGPQTLCKMLQNAQNLENELDRRNNEVQSIEMTPFRSSTLQDDVGTSYLYHDNSSNTGLQRVSQYIQSLPDHPAFDTINDHTSITHQDQEQILYADAMQAQMNSSKVNSESASSPIPPPPAPPDPPTDVLKKNGPTTGERIFNALRSVTSQSYIDASEFYNSVLSSAQQVQRFTFSRSPSMVNENTGSRLQNEVRDIYTETDSDAIGLDASRRSSDLYSPELNLEAHRTAQEVYYSLQDPPSSPLLLKDHNHESYTFMSDPSFTRTSEDIFNSLEQRRKSMERLNGIHEFVEHETSDTQRRRNSQELYAVLENVQIKRRLSQQSLEENYITNYSINEHERESNSGSRRGSQGPEPEPPPPDESNLKRAISCESVCSDTSVVLNDLEEAPVVGHVCVGLEHERWGGRGTDSEGDLAVSVLEARDLVAPDARPAQDTFARVCLLPDRQTHVQTRLYRGSPSPSYQEKFLFPLDGGPAGRTLLVEVFSDESSIGGGASLIGEASLRLGPAARPPATTWLPLTGPALPTPYLGELMFSLSYLPTAERLTLVVVKARNLRGSNTIPGDFFVKVYLLQQGKKLHKKKTSVKKGEKSPIFNEAIIFSVPPHALQTIQLRLTVSEVHNEQTTNTTRTNPVGHVFVGSTSAGRALAHWRQMLAALRRPVARWHPLRK
ncbi:uncharacterized protein LOC122513677 isoform X1 [Polistes fuscatus]|uniref:uncharacterized protein LOC122513677 isoform X1 n=1 Tax=Polistes fuscatus TaxID=30207 RepID=UPI001CA93F28|nr:uncharacterized protein LOC122513677 isoform X1 [Polistes fuscatus]XP_043486030.1 uncharacterized protein LOC122513677 isoform X1 [Polistes fuscatus]XP_043486031.1 uncharacterized protein LOC122513677 isoform X1 [Polistes fuscatus]